MLLEDLLVGVAQFLQTFGRYVGIEIDLVLGLDLAERLLKMFVLHTHDDVTEHVDQAAIRVIGKSLVAGRFRLTHHRFVGQSKIQNRIHHAGHGDGRTTADRDQQGILLVAELLAQFLLQRLDLGGDLLRQARRQFAARFVIGRTTLGRDREPGRHGKSNSGHLGQIGTLATQQLFLLAVAVGARLAEIVGHLRLGHLFIYFLC